MQEYVLIDAEQISVDRYRRLSPRRWELQTFLAGEMLDLTCVNWQEPLDLIYEDVRFAADSQEL